MQNKKPAQGGFKIILIYDQKVTPAEIWIA